MGPTLVSRQLEFAAGGRRILGDVTVTVPAGKVSAILGPSGSGKSTLLKCLTSVYTPTAGKVLVGEKPLDPRGIRATLGYVPQDDVIHRELRVEDAFLYAARLRLGSTLGEDVLRERVTVVLRRLGLAEKRRTRVRRLSGGQRKRVNIGVELLAEPELLVLDEPASGLDPATEGDVLDVLRELAAEGRTVLLTTHSMEFLHRMDQLIVLMDGLCIFTGTEAELLAHFGIARPAEMFEVIRERDAAEWKRRRGDRRKAHTPVGAP